VVFAGPARPDGEVSILHLAKVDWMKIDGALVRSNEHLEARLLPGRYYLEWGRTMPGRIFMEEYQTSAYVTLEPGHVYSAHVDREHPFGQGYIPYFWIEDVGTGVVVSGSKRERPPSRGPREHEFLGLFLRLTMDVGPARTSVHSGSEESRWSGEEVGGSIAAGIVVRRNLALHFNWSNWEISDPDVETGALSGGARGDIDLDVFSGGLTYYFMPANIYVSGAIGVGNWKGAVRVQDTEISMKTDTGLVMDISTGKEWWIGEGWGVGIGGGFGYHSMSDITTDGTRSGTRWTFLLSATFN
jgi:hypothetical protein